MISAINPIQYGDNERRRLSGIGSRRIGFQGFHQRVKMSCMGSEKNEQ